ncbi:MAG: tetratricopeptide repeat protein [Spirochaetaceae bacterium]|nr:tetratricopeptide repeat protein [Spirochaetaceae bacterium]
MGTIAFETKRTVKRLCLGLGLWGLFLSPAFAQDTRGEELFLLNKPQEAVPLLELSLRENPANIRAGLYLGISYQQLDLPDDAIAVFLKILPRGGDETARIAFNLGNLYYTKGNIPYAQGYYTQAIQADPAYASAYLNRANILLEAGAVAEAVSDYERYLSLEPRSPKRPRIEQLLLFIKEEIAAEERRRVEADRAVRAEAERKQRLLDEISASLQAAAEETTGLSAGAEDVLGYDEQFELE